MNWKAWPRRRRAPASPAPSKARRNAASRPTTQIGGQGAFEDLQRRALLAFEELIEASDEARQAWLQQTAPHDSALATAVAALLVADSGGHDRLPTAPGEPANDEPSAPPVRAGPYRLVRRLGGGMGEVFLAERDDGLFQHTVAIKLIKNGRTSQALSQHLREEGRILASLQHPNIAQLFGGGTTAGGLPFIVMEYLPGQTLTDHMDRATLGLRDRLKLFLTVCDAVQFVHQNLIVHADIKPSNIIVTATAGVKLLDFGIARLVDPQAAGADGGGALAPMTRAYAAPERRQGAPPSVSADVYSLGVLLYEILTGHLPEAAEEAAEEATDRADDPAASPPANRPPSVARAAAGSEEPIRSKDLRGGLDAVSLRALAPDPRHRYANVVQLAEDVNRYLDGLPVRALPDTWQYRSERFIRRHRLGLATTSVLMAVAGVTAVGTTLLYLQSERDRALADRRFAETRSMADYIINDVDTELTHVPGSIPLRRLLVTKSHSYLQALESDRLASPALKLDVAAGYLRLARIYGLDVSGGVGDLAAARDSLRHARAILADLAKTDPTEPRLLLLGGEAEIIAGSEAFVALDASTLKQALSDLKSAQDLFSRYLALRPSDIDAQLGLWRAQVMCARIYNEMGDPRGGLAAVESNLHKASIPVKTRDQAAQRDFILNGSYLMLAEGYEDADPKKAFGYYDLLARNVAAIQARGQSDQEDDFIQSTAYAGMGAASARLGDLPAAIRNDEAALATMARLLRFGPNHEIEKNQHYIFTRLALLYAKAGRADEARRTADLAIASSQADLATRPNDPGALRLLGIGLQGRATVERLTGTPAQACVFDRRAMAQWDVVQRKGIAVAGDLAPGGPLEMLRADTARDCGA